MPKERSAMTFTEDSVEVTIRLPRAAYSRAWEMVTETDWDMRRRYGLDEPMSVEDFLALLLERTLR
jgi:hypothetical protein